MAVTIDYPNKIINVPKSYLTLVSGSVYSMDTNQLRLDVIALLDDELGITEDDAIRHNTTVSLGGVTYARTIEFVNGYTITFENGTYAINLTGSNNNISDVMNVNSVSLRSANSAGLVVTSGSSGSAADVWAYSISGKTAANRLTDADDNAELAAVK